KELRMTRATSFKTPARYFALENVFIDNQGNKYFSYEFGEKEFMGDITDSKRGILMENNSGKESFQTFNPGETYSVKQLRFENSFDNSKVYVHANYYGKNRMEGVVLTTLDPANLKINSPKLISYSGEVRETLSELTVYVT